MAERILGINIAAGVAYLMVFDGPGAPVVDAAEQIKRAVNLEPGDELADFAARAAQLLRDLGVEAVGVAHPRLYGGWKWTDAFDRASLETCFALKAKELGIHYESVSQHKAAKTIGVPLPKVESALLTKLAIEQPTYWAKKRCQAALVGAALALWRAG